MNDQPELMAFMGLALVVGLFVSWWLLGRLLMWVWSLFG